MQRISIIISFLIFLSLQSRAQNESDALRYSMVTPGGTARSISMGSAFGALGGDFSSLSINPAGIGIYRRSEFTITPNFSTGKVGSNFYGTTEEDIKYDFNLGNIGLVFAFNSPGQPNEPGWRGFQVGFGVNRHMNFNNRSVYEGFNTDSSLMTEYLYKADAENNPWDPKDFDPFTTDLAWETYLLDTLNGVFLVDMENGNVLQRRETNTSGSIREMVLTFGTNYSDKLYLGASFGFPRVNYESQYIYIEQDDPSNPNQYFNSLELNDNVKTTGNGFNFKFGAIFRATDMIRLGAAVHTPTFYDLEDQFKTILNSDLSFGKYDASSPNGRFNYELNTPMRLIGSLGLVFGTQGLLSFDYEYADYTQMRLRSNTYMFTNENRVIRNNFETQHNFRIGGEVRLDPIILRAGYALNTSPYKSGVNDAQRGTISGGIGMRDKNFFIDFGYYLTQYSENYYPYSSSLTQPVQYDYTRNGFLMTLGFRF